MKWMTFRGVVCLLVFLSGSGVCPAQARDEGPLHRPGGAIGARAGDAFLEGYFSIDQPESGESVILDAMGKSLQQRLRVLEHAGIEVPRGIDGRAWGAGRTHAFGWLYPHRRRKTEELRSVQSDGWKLISSSSGELELYNLHRDPRELVDLSVAEVEQRRVLLEALEQAPIDPARRPKPSPELSDETLDRLRTLGYLR